MLRVRLQGINPFAQGAGVVPRFKPIPYVNVFLQTDITVGNTTTSVPITGGGAFNTWVRFRNISTAGQQIRIGTVGVTIGGGVGTLLYPGEEWNINQLDVSSATSQMVFAIADAASATLNIIQLASVL